MANHNNLASALIILALAFAPSTAKADYVHCLAAFAKKEFEKAVEKCTEAAEGGSKEAAFILAITYGKMEKSKESDEWMKKAAKAGDQRAKIILELSKKYGR